MDAAATRPGTADLHVHTHFSDGVDSPRDVLARAERIGLDVIAVTDHDCIEGALVAAEYARSWPTGLDVIVGEEISSRDGHILALFISELIPADLSAEDTVAAIHEQQGLAIAAHPFWRRGQRGRNGRVYGVGDLIATVDFDAVEVINGGFTPSMIVANRRAAEAAAHLDAAEVGGSDAHVKHAIAWANTKFDGSTAADLRRAIVSRTTRAARSRPGFAGMQRYAFWSLRRLRPQPVAG